MHSPVSNGDQGGIRPTQSFNLASKKGTSQHGNLRMYEFKVHKSRDRKPDWEIVERTLVAKSESELRRRIKKPLKKSARDFESQAVAGKKGFKQRQILQLLQDLQRHDQRFKWQVELIELPEIKFDNNLGMTVSSKMIVIVSCSDNQGYPLEPAKTFDLYDAIVDLRPHAHQIGSADHYGGGSQPMPHGHENLPPPLPRQHAGQLYGQSTPEIRDRRPAPEYQRQDTYGQQHPEGRAEASHAKTEKKDTKDEKKGKIEPVVHIITPPKDQSDSDSSSDVDSGSDVKTSNTSETSVSIGSPSGGKKYYDSKDRGKDSRKHVPEASREHRRKNPPEYLQNARGRSAKEAVVIQPASSHRRRQSSQGPEPSYRPKPSYRPEPSYERVRPTRPISDDSDEYEEPYEEYFRRYDESPKRRQGSTYAARRRTQALVLPDEVEKEKEGRLQAEIENLKLKRRIKELDQDRWEAERREAYQWEADRRDQQRHDRNDRFRFARY